MNAERNAEFLPNHITALYRLLGHGDLYSRVGALDCASRAYENRIVKGEQAVLEYAKKWNGIRNVFIGRSARDQNGRVVSRLCCSFDIDPVRPKGHAATEQQHQAAIAAGRKILSAWPGGYLSSSGNGCLLVYRVGNDINGIEDSYAKEAEFIKELQELVKEYPVKIDQTAYDEAVVKLIGTFSTKGARELRRCSRFLDFPLPPFRGCPRLLERIKLVVPQPKLVVSGVDISELSRFRGDRSVADYHLVSYLKKAGVGPADALQALKANPLGRKEERPDDWPRLIGKIYGADAVSVPDAAKSGYFDSLFQAGVESDRGISTGFGGLDEAMGTLPKGEISSFAARSGFGKSTLACTISEHLRSIGKKVLYFSTEMHRDYIMHKLVAIRCGIPLKRVIRKEFDRDEEGRIKCYRADFEKNAVRICDTFQPTVDEVRNEILKHKPDLVVFDHINQAESHWEKVVEYVNKLKEIVSQEQLPLLMLCELGEPPRGKDGTTVQSVRGDVRGSQAIIFISANFVLIDNPYEVKGNLQPVELKIAKNRYGDGAGNIVPMAVNKEISRFMERTVHEDEERA